MKQPPAFKAEHFVIPNIDTKLSCIKQPGVFKDRFSLFLDRLLTADLTVHMSYITEQPK